jgi:hypothetical protein
MTPLLNNFGNDASSKKVKRPIGFGRRSKRNVKEPNNLNRMLALGANTFLDQVDATKDEEVAEVRDLLIELRSGFQKEIAKQDDAWARSRLAEKLFLIENPNSGFAKVRARFPEEMTIRKDAQRVRLEEFIEITTEAISRLEARIAPQA